jgi:putative oxidoreductase
MTILSPAISAHLMIFSWVERQADRWALGLMLRLVFIAVLMPYYLNSFLTKVGPGIAGFFEIQASAYYQIVPQAVDAAGGDIDAIGAFPYGLIVLFGTYAEILLPVMIAAGVFTRLASLGMIGFIVVQSAVDIVFHQVNAATIGQLFDRFPDSVILDQRLLWIALLLVLVAKGAGRISVDGMLPTRT